MNQIEEKLQVELSKSVKKAFDVDLDSSTIKIEIPREKGHGDYASNVAMQITKLVKKNPREVASAIVENLDNESAGVSSVEIAGPGFLNFTMSSDSLTKVISTVLSSNEKYGENTSGANKRYNLEYVSANPTGNLHLGHARGAAWGDSVSRLMMKSGYDVTREYYVNDAGNQIDNLGYSLRARYNQALGNSMDLPEDGYHGEDVTTIANKIVELVGDKYKGDMSDEALNFFKVEGKKFELDKIKQDLEMFRVSFDVWTSELSLYENGKVEEAIEVLKNKEVTYEEDGALWFRTTDYGDDKDRVLIKTDGSYTYLVPDIAYHNDKLNRADYLIDFLGADHHGYINRLKASVQALGRDSDAIEVDIIQMVRIVEDGVEVKMSKRTGNAITIRELCEEVGVDSVRYFFVQRALESHLDFDMSLAKKQSNDNPVYYAQYAYARIHSILAQAPTYAPVSDYNLLVHEKEVALMKYINEFPNVVADAAATRAPNKVCNYIQKLAQHFHSFYGVCKVNDESHPELSAQRVDLLKATQITLGNAFELVAVEAKDVM